MFFKKLSTLVVMFLFFTNSAIASSDTKEELSEKKVLPTLLKFMEHKEISYTPHNEKQQSFDDDLAPSSSQKNAINIIFVPQTEDSTPSKSDLESVDFYIQDQETHIFQTRYSFENREDSYQIYVGIKESLPSEETRAALKILCSYLAFISDFDLNKSTLVFNFESLNLDESELESVDGSFGLSELIGETQSFLSEVRSIFSLENLETLLLNEAPKSHKKNRSFCAKETAIVLEQFNKTVKLLKKYPIHCAVVGVSFVSYIILTQTNLCEFGKK